MQRTPISLWIVVQTTRTSAEKRFGTQNSSLFGTSPFGYGNIPFKIRFPKVVADWDYYDNIMPLIMRGRNEVLNAEQR